VDKHSATKTESFREHPSNKNKCGVLPRPQVGDRADDLQIWRVAANILNRRPWTANSQPPA
jgi:hypothetical protein